MDTSQIEDVLNVSQILTSHAEGEAAHNPSLIADLIQWRDDTQITVDPKHVVADKPASKAKASKATESDDSDSRVTPDPSSEPDF